ncbi:MAG TPA: hypothetical protein VHN82_08565 [Methanoregula sp.]|nr:hypothetical protein [Methanoregula sp.]
MRQFQIKIAGKPIPRTGKVLAGITVILAIALVIICLDPFFKDFDYLKFFLVCGIGIANLVLWYTIKT